jgi:polyhydroxyalkanoate synthesis regulator phasin
MLEMIRKGFMAGIGAVVLTAEKIQEVVKKLVEEGKITTEEGEKLAQDLVKSGERQWEEISAKIAEKSKRFAEGLEPARSPEYDELKARIESLEQRLAEIEKGQG